jgi:tetratricopeptide (TPR) repeat protein
MLALAPFVERFRFCFLISILIIDTCQFHPHRNTYLYRCFHVSIRRTTTGAKTFSFLMPLNQESWIFFFFFFFFNSATTLHMHEVRATPKGRWERLAMPISLQILTAFYSWFCSFHCSGPSHADTGNAYQNLAVVLRRQGKLDEAAAMYKDAIEILTTALGMFAVLKCVRGGARRRYILYRVRGPDAFKLCFLVCLVLASCLPRWMWLYAGWLSASILLADIFVSRSSLSFLSIDTHPYFLRHCMYVYRSVCICLYYTCAECGSEYNYDLPKALIAWLVQCISGRS